MSKMSKEVKAVLEYSERTNRPYNLNDLCQSLPKEFSKTILQKALTELISENKIKEKIYNKQKIYSVIQKPSTENDLPKAVQECDFKMRQMTETLKKLEQDLKIGDSELKKYASTMTFKEAQDRRKELQELVKLLESKLSELSQNTKPILQTDRDKVERDYEVAVKAYRSRKRICTDILDSILENYPKKKSVLIEEIGLELDDEKNTPPPVK